MNCENHGKKETEKSWFVLFLFTFFAPTGLNYLYLGLKKRAMCFVTTYFVAIIASITTLIFLNRTKVGILIFILATMFIFSFATILKFIVFWDTLNIAKKMSKGIPVEDTTEDLLNFLEKHQILISTVILSIPTALFTMNIIACSLHFNSVFPLTLKGMILTLILLSSTTIMLLGITYLTIRSWFEIDCVSVQAIKNSEQQDNPESVEKEIVDHTNIDAQIQEIANISNELLHFIEQTPNIEEDPDKVMKLKMFLNDYIPSTSILLKDYRRLKDQENLQNQLMKKVEKEISISVSLVKNQLDMLTKEKADETLTLRQEIKKLNDSLKEEGLLED